MIDKYIKLILLSTILLQASPKLFNGYGNQLEPLNKDCKTYRKLSLLPKDIKKKCKLYNSKVNRAFKYGYKLDSSVDNDNVNLDKAEKYNSYLRELEENKDNIISLIQNEIYKASKPENIKYYSQLITSNAIALDDYNYRFMKKHKEKFNTNPKYIAFERDMYLKEEERLKEELYSLQIKNEKNEKVIRDLKRQKQKIQISSEKEVAKFRKSLKKAREIILSLRDKEKANIKNRMNTKTQVKSSTTCKQDMVYASSSAENATDYALKGNHKYALIEVKEAIIGTAQALESCKDKVESYKIDELSKNLSSLNVTKKQIESKLSRNSSSSSKTTYTIIKDDNMRDIHGNYVKRSVEVILSKKVNPDKLKHIAYAIKQIDKTSYKRTFIGYYLSDTDSKHSYWATTHFNPNLKVEILGMSIEDEKIINKKDISVPDREIIGSWLENRPPYVNRMILYYKKNRFYLEQIFKTYTKTTEMNFEKLKRGIKIVDIEGGRFGEYYLLSKKGDLEFWSKTRNYYTPKKLLNQEITKTTMSQMIKQWDSTAFNKEKALKIKKELSKRTKQIEVTLEYYTQGTLTYFMGTTNLPENTKIGIQLNDRASDFKIYIKKDGSYLSTGFGDRGSVLSGNYKVEVMIYSNISWQTKDIIEKLKNYHGYGFVKEGHASIIKNYSFGSK